MRCDQCDRDDGAVLRQRGVHAQAEQTSKARKFKWEVIMSGLPETDCKIGERQVAVWAEITDLAVKIQKDKIAFFTAAVVCNY